MSDEEPAASSTAAPVSERLASRHAPQIIFISSTSLLYLLIATEEFGKKASLALACTILSGIWSCSRVQLAKSNGAVVTVALTVALSCFALAKGQDVNFDQRNYHFAIAHLFQSEGYQWNIAPAQMQTWLNPLIYVYQFLFSEAFGSIVFALFSVFIVAMAIPAVYFISIEVQGDRPYRNHVAFLSILVGFTAPMLLSEVGTTFFDAWAGSFVCLALLCVLWACRSARSKCTMLLLAAGALLGVVTGLKLTNGVYAAAMGVAVLFSRWPTSRLTALVVLAAGGTVGFLASGGWWALRLWQDYGNPFFPYFNSVFNSELLEGVTSEIREGHGADKRYIPPNPLWALTYPLAWAKGSLFVSSEAPFRDARWALLLAIGAIVLIGRLRKNRFRSRDGSQQAQNLTTSFFLFALIFWFGGFAIHRYLIPLEMLSGVMLTLSLLALVRNSLGAALLMVPLVFAVVAWAKPADWGRIPFQEKMVPSAAELYEPNVLFVLIGHDPTGFVVAGMPGDARFVRISGNMTLSPSAGLGKQAFEIIQAHAGPVRSLALTPPNDEEQHNLARFGLRPSGRCRTAQLFTQEVALPFYLSPVTCKLSRAVPSTGGFKPIDRPIWRDPCTGPCAVVKALPELKWLY